jgi:hypothetical protein
MASDPRSKEALRLRLNRPAVVGVFPTRDYSERADKAIVEWWADIFAFYEIDPASPTRWERVAWCLACEAFPKFNIVSYSRAAGAPSTRDKIVRLLDTFDAFQPGGGGSKYKAFLRDHAQNCTACGIEEPGALKGAMLRARRQRALDQQAEAAFVRFETMKALGII